VGADAEEACRQRRDRLRVGKADETRSGGSEAGPWQNRDACLGEKTVGKLALRQTGGGDVGEDVESASRPLAADAVDGIQTLDDEVTAPAVLAHHARQR